MIKQTPVQQFSSNCNKAHVIVENDMPLGEFHDFLLRLKGQMVDLMIKAQKEDEAAAAVQKENANCEAQAQAE